MAYDNLFYSLGSVVGKRKITKSRASDEAISAGMYLRIYRDAPEINNQGVNQSYYDEITVYTNKKEMIEKIRSLETTQMVMVSGLFVSRDVRRRYVCECGQEVEWMGTANYVSPLALKGLENPGDEVLAARDLEANKEMSNQFRTIGTLVVAPEYYEDERGNTYCSYGLGVNRARAINLEETIPQRADYFRVRSFGPQAISDKNRLSLDSVVMVKGSLAVREVPLEKVCPACGRSRVYVNKVTELMADRVEYLDGYRGGFVDYEYPDLAKKSNVQKEEEEE